ncbi:MAG: 23S rRNA (adenine(2503)-C(2))-methyltransferase RlmN [Oscillospiraceae bacterium]|nr:23S rRNA (adenine(2503)-C(2))-methyltransferase RlmN [Oscillospiraceae bacterium]
MNIYNMTFPALEAYFSERGENKAKAKIIYNALYKKRTSDFELSPRVTEMLQHDFTFESIKIIEKSSCPNAVKLLFGLHDNNAIEAVLMRHDYGNALCISTQVGCNMSCAFCQSGQRDAAPKTARGAGNKIRDLFAYEMVLQLLEAEKNLGEKISRVTLMGIGEPLDNLENVMDFINIIGHPHGLDIAPRHITISTCGLPKLDELSEISCNLAISLHAPNDEIRSRIMPVNSAYSIEKIIAFSRTRKKKTTLEYIMLSGVNDSDDCAHELADLVRGINCYVNLIPYNETSLSFARSSAERIKSFYSILIQSGIRAVVRKEFGGELKAACGQLRAERNKT